MTTLSKLAQHALVPVVVLDNSTDAEPLAQALVAGGLPVAEITFRTEAAEESIRIMAQRGDMLIGAGTVLTVDQVDRAVAAGADYIVSPGLSHAVVKRAHEHGVLALPGAVTATEIQAAVELGLSAVKFFPAQTSGGAPAIKALSAPFSHLSFVPTGGINATNLRDYLSLNCVAAAGGSWMVEKTLVNEGRFDLVEKLTQEAVQLVAQIKGQ
ncbi:bifunctional 4-hydroxy-2-oxoglutarate aldolase/2-dehydro-3-deoxy-phosphogluconate aldolase [Timonella sp. A28]|uniref:bifunctional 4-hydroxy-2-oxoglutarate aldolase/2-dehydro-3-deoxy-phosphogluconate aldolase n=1 Tax=Timonella sp. A28 TaxID=3442640 RepID=UPI003EB75DA2